MWVQVRWQLWATGSTQNFFSVELTCEVSLTGLLSLLGSNICKTQDHSHSDTTPLYYIYIYIYRPTICVHIYIWWDVVKNSKVKKMSIYKRVIYYFPSRWKIKYLIVFSKKLLFQKCFLKFLTKISVKKPSNTLFSIKMENYIFNSLYTEIFVSPCVYKLIMHIYIYLVILRQPFMKTIGRRETRTLATCVSADRSSHHRN